MPDYIENRIAVDSQMEQIAEFIKGSDRAFDFNKVTKMPEELNIDAGSHSFHYLRPSILPTDEIIENIRNIGEEKIKIKELNNFLASIKNYVLLGYPSWYEFCIDKWGTKWNTLENGEWKNGSIRFMTAWNGVPKLIKELSKHFPEVIFYYKFSSEVAGNCIGRMYIKNGECIMDNSPKQQSHDAYSLYKELHPDNTSYQEIDGIWNYISEEYPNNRIIVEQA